MRKSFESCGFEANCEYLLADNSQGNSFSAYEAIRGFLRESKAEYVLIAHQDVRCLEHKEYLLKCLHDVSDLDAKWAVCGNAGAMGYRRNLMYIDNNGIILKSRNLPARATSLDENFLIVKASSNLTLSDNFSSFHLYGTDLCLIADILGYSCYVIPFLVKHLSHGNMKELPTHINVFVRNYGKKLRSRYIQTSCTRFYLSNSEVKNQIYNSSLVFFFVRLFQGIKYSRSLIKFHKNHKIDKTYYDA